jgi:hypothetical protein
MKHTVNRIPGPNERTLGAIADDFCPHLGTWHDSSICFTEPDTGNRCYLRFSKVRIFWIFKKRIPGAWIAVKWQHSTCYGDYHNCCYYR